MSPKLSFVMPTRNRLEWIGESLQSLLMQTVIKDSEIIIVNDASDDGTKEFLDEWASQFPEVKIIHNETRQGGGKSRNIGMEAAQSPIIAVCDDDDIYPMERGAYILAYFEEHPEAELVNFPYKRIGYFNEPMEEFNGKEFSVEDYQAGRDIYFCNPTVAYKKEAGQAIGGYGEENEKETDDSQFLRKWVEAGKKINFQGGFLLCFHRVLPNSMMSKHRGWKPEWAATK